MARKKAPAQIKIRLPEALRRDLEREAAKHGRTLNGEIVYRLTQPFIQADREAVAAAAASDAVKNLLAKISPEDFAKAAEEVAPSPAIRLANILPTKPRSSKPEDNSK